MDDLSNQSKQGKTAARTRLNLYCDESCHLLNDGQGIMVLGSVWCPFDDIRRISLLVRRLKVAHGLGRKFESKWTKVSPAKAAFYTSLVDLFFDEPCLHFRGLIVSKKENLDHKAFGQTHDEWYYKMYFRLLHPILRPDAQYRIYLDIKDTRSAAKIRKLGEVLANANYDFDRTIISQIQTVRSHDVEILQIADLFIGALSYLYRGIKNNTGKLSVIEHIKQHTSNTLLRSTLIAEPKFNLFVWTPQNPPRDPA